MTNADSALAGALDELAAVGSARDRELIAALRDRLDAARLRVLVAGEAKRGKSTLINALLGRAVLPAGVTPLTAVATAVRYGDDPHAEVRFADGHEEKQPLTALPDLVTERGNPGNRRRIAAVTVYLDAPLLTGGVELVDTPGTGSVFAWDTAAAHEALETMDAAVFVLTADPPVSAAERDLYAKVAGLSVATFTVLNKADHLDEAGLSEAAEFTRQVLAEAAGGPGATGRIYALSARAALNGGDPGFAAFAADFKAYLARRRVTDLRSSAVMQARRIAGSLLDEVALTRRAAQLAAGDAADRVARFSERLAEVAVRGKDAVAVVNAESARLLMALNDAAEADRPRLGRTVSRQLEEVLGGELRTVPPVEIERQGREQLVTLTLATADAWRAQRQDVIEEGLGRTDARLAADLTAALGVLRDSAAQLLGLDLAVPEPGAGSRRTAGSSTRPPKRPARPNCWPVPSAAGSPASWGAAVPATTCAARPPAWWPVRSAGPGRTCSTGCRRRPASWPVPWSCGTRKPRAGCRPPCRRPRNCGAPRPPTRPARNASYPAGRRRSVTRLRCSATRARSAGRQRRGVSPRRSGGRARRQRSRAAACAWRAARRRPGRRA